MDAIRFEPIDDRRNILGEGPFWDEETQTLYLADIVGRRILAYDAAGAERGAWTMPDVVSTAVVRRDGGLLVTLRDGVYLFETGTGDLQRLASPDPDKSNRSNEARTDPQGRLWFGTMQNNIGPNGEPLPVDRSTGTLSVVEPDGKSRIVLTGIGISNTLCWSPHGDRLYFADTVTRVINSYRFDADNADLSDRQIFSDLEGYGSPDGSAIDESGYLWNARWGGSCIIRFTPSGSVDRIVEVPVKQPTSCVFGGPDRTTLFVTSATHGLDKGSGGLDGATLAAATGIRGERCVRFAG
jgi:sugar lactone lactonase YvrE